MIRPTLFLLLFIAFVTACAPAKKSITHSAAILQSIFDTTAVFKKGVTGFILMDAPSGQFIYGRNQDNYFTPASNTKILTLAVCLRALGDTLAGIEYVNGNNTLIFRGTGDPTFLHPQFEYWQPAYQFLTSRPAGKGLSYTARPFPEKRFGPGWAWDDYADYYQPERSVMPIYGNIAKIAYSSDSNALPVIYPDYFQKNVVKMVEGAPVRLEEENTWSSRLRSTTGIPFRTKAFLPLLRDTLHRPDLEEIEYNPSIFDQPGFPWKTMHSTPVDTVLRMMMYESDNFFAEQLLIMSAQKLTQTMRQDSVIPYAINNIFTPSPTPPRWVDGSGLSRYNLITPHYLSNVLKQLYDRTPKEQLFTYFPAGGVRGTISNWYRNPEGSPYVLAKTGSMSGVHCLSGFILTKSGKTLIFSFMHNNFVGSSKPWKMEMQRILEWIYLNY